MKRLPQRSGKPDPGEKNPHALTGHQPKAPAPGTADGEDPPPDTDPGKAGNRRMRGLDKSGGSPGGGR
jgi:hypothetical protein